MKDVKVYAQNLRSYNMGLDQGRWLTLGIEEQELQRILTEQLHLTENHPDMAIFDYQADFEISEYEDIYELNQAVAQLKQLPEQDYEKVMDYCDATIDQDKGTVTFDIGPNGSTAKAQLTGAATFTNQMIQGSIKLIKKDSNGRVLKDVEFVIQSSDGAEVAKAKTDAAGEVTFDGLISDTYTITETKTTGGKTLLKEPITVTLPLTMSQAEVDKQNVDTSKAIKQGR